MKIEGLLIDLDGVVYNDSRVIEGAIDTLNWLRDKNIPFRFLTNTTMKSRETLRLKMKHMGITVPGNYIFSAVYAAALYVKQKKFKSCYLMLLPDAKREFEDLSGASEKVDCVVAGDLGESVTFDILNEAFLHLKSGAELVALQKNRFWLSDTGFKLDAGAFVALLEFAANKEATVIGKPNRAFFEMALMDLGLSPERVLMIGDDPESDIAGACRAGIKTCLVQSGKFRAGDPAQTETNPDFMLGSIGQLPMAGIL